MKKTAIIYLHILIITLHFLLLTFSSSYSQEQPVIDIDQALSRLPAATQNISGITPKINDPLQYNYTTAKLIFDETFQDNRNRWSQDKEKDSVNKQLVFFKPGTGLVLQLNNDIGLSANTIGWKSSFDFTQNFEYEISYDIRQTSPKKKVSVSFCIATDTSHTSGLNLSLTEEGQIYSSNYHQKQSKRWKGTTFFVSKKIRSDKAKISIRSMDGIYDIFYNGHYLGRLKNRPITTGKELHIGIYRPNTSACINALRLYAL